MRSPVHPDHPAKAAVPRPAIPADCVATRAVVTDIARAAPQIADRFAPRPAAGLARQAPKSAHPNLLAAPNAPEHGHTLHFMRFLRNR